MASNQKFTTSELISITSIEDSEDNLALTISRIIGICNLLHERLTAAEAEIERLKSGVIFPNRTTTDALATSPLDSPQERKPIWSGDEWCDRQAGFPTVYDKWQELFGEVLDTNAAVKTVDGGDHMIYHMPNGYEVWTCCDGNSIYAPVGQ